ncbi:phage integrase [Nautilia profundicola AmH]|uniref:Phage integrase n=1 Tax=Nautilia profundicola (strain ATCC BAA-1463 / DSM 18972 / AmH) TaxID=598659 RepID=B9L7T1_NAUPA|nr:tyrosine-type recombinase/integrase [Nautilia profundicola]ACM92860.1 phage integrase [Nautilia profundicola AmH]
MKKFLQKEINKFLNFVKKTKSHNTYKTYETVLNEAINFIEIENNIINITPYRLHIAELNKKTIAKKVSALRSFFEFLETEGHKFKIIGDEHIKVPKTLPKPVSMEHIKKALKSATMDEYLAIITIFSLGLRISEAAGITLSDIKGDWIEIRGKGAKTRLLPVHPKLKDFINKYLEIHPKKEYLFEKEGVPLGADKIRYLIQRAFKKHGIHVTPHQLRHSFATYMLQNGARINDVSELLGHEFISTTQIYTKLSNSLKLQNYLKAHPLCS